MATLRTVYERATGRPVFEGFGPDPTQNLPGHGAVETSCPPLEEAAGPPRCGTEESWVIQEERVLRADYPQAGVTMEGLTVTLGLGHLFGQVHAQVSEADSYTFAEPQVETAMALDIALDGQGQAQLQPYQWDPNAEPPQTKGDLPQGWTLVRADVLRGILPAGADSLDQLQEEVG